MNAKNALKPYGALNFGNRVKGDLKTEVGTIEMKFPPLFRYYNNYDDPNGFRGNGSDEPPKRTLPVDADDNPEELIIEVINSMKYVAIQGG
jgi:hypothetical protein